MTAAQIFDYVKNSDDSVRRSFVFWNGVDMLLPPKDDGTEKSAALRAMARLPVDQRRALAHRIDQEARPGQMYTVEPPWNWGDGWWYDR